MAFDGYKFERPTGRPLRVALFSGNYNYTLDGANKSLNRLVDHLESVEGAEVRVYSPTTATPAFEPKGQLISAPSAPIPTRPDYRLSLPLTPALRRNIEAFAPDVVHLSCPDPLGFSVQKLARQLGAPTVASVHTRFETYVSYYGMDWLRPLIERKLHDFYDACDYILATTPAMAEQMGADGLGERMRVWSRGVDRALFDPARRDMSWRRSLGFADDQPVVTFFGRLVMEKNLGVFVDTVRRLESGPTKVGVLVIGDGPARAWLEERLPQAVFTGFLTGETLARAVASADVLLNPSKTETFCNATLEAMASGLTVVASDAPNHRSLLHDGETGLLRSADDPAAYTEALTMLFARDDLRDRLRRGAREASAAYSWDQILSGVVDVYYEALAAMAPQGWSGLTPRTNDLAA